MILPWSREDLQQQQQQRQKLMTGFATRKSLCKYFVEKKRQGTTPFFHNEPSSLSRCCFFVKSFFYFSQYFNKLARLFINYVFISLYGNSITLKKATLKRPSL